MPGQLGVFLAYPGIGKSWLALYFAVQAWKQGKSPMVISLEMSETEVRNRVFTIMGEGRWSHRKISNGEIEIDMLKDWHAKNLAGKFRQVQACNVNLWTYLSLCVIWKSAHVLKILAERTSTSNPEHQMEST